MILRTNAKIIPVFYGVEVQDVRWSKGKFAVVSEHRKNFDSQTVDEWTAALHQASNISGFSLKHCHGLAKYVVDEVLKEVYNEQLEVAKFPVGLNEPVAELREHILQRRAEEKNVTVVGIVGIGGSGKSTLAKALYNNIRSQFKAAAFVDNIKEIAQKSGLKEVQRILIQSLLHYRHHVSNIAEGKVLLRKRLIGADVLDNVEEYSQTDALLVEDVLCPRSTIICTSRSRHLLKRWNNSLVYDIKGLNSSQSRQLFCWHAFQKDCPSSQPFESLAERTADMCKGLPLALEICGGQLYGESYEYWESYWQKMSKVMSPAIQNILRASYDELEQKQKEIFLDIAVFFNGENKEMATRIWEGWEETFWLIDLLILEHKCLIKFEKGCLRMHDLLCDFGRLVVDEECLEDPGRRRRLWRKTDVHKVLTNGSGTESVRGVSLVSEGSVVWKEERLDKPCGWSTRSFAGMRGLKLLVLQDACLLGDFSKLTHTLLWIRWWNCPNQYCMPPNLQMENLRVLDFRGGNVVNLWKDESKVTFSAYLIIYCTHLQSLLL
eukprot:Gb_09816 [translate_table: standard]